MTSLPPKRFGQRDHAERDRHPRLDARDRVLLAPDRARSEPVPSSRRRCRTGWRPGRSDRAAANSRSPPGAASVSRSITSSRMPVSAATRSMKPSAFDAARQASVAISRRRLARLRLDLVAADAQRRDGAVDRGVADTAGRRDPLAEPDDARERIDHAKTVAGRTGDQQAAIVGAEVQRGIDAGCRRRRMACRRARQPAAQLLPLAATRRALAVVSARPKAVAKPRVLVHSKCFPRPAGADVEFPFTETLAARHGSAQQPFTCHHAQSGVVVPISVRYLRETAKIVQKPAFQVSFQCKINRPQPLWKTLSHCKNTASGSRSAARKTTRWCAARANTPTISTCPARPMPGSCAPAMPTASSAASTPRPPRRCRACSASGPEPTLPPPIMAPSPAACR